MPPSGGEEARHGTQELPHTAQNIKAMVSCLPDGYSVAFRWDSKVIWARLGPGNRKRTAPFGVPLSVISDAHEHSELARKIDRAKYLYLVKSGAGHAAHASFDRYKLPNQDTGACVVAPPAP